MNEHILVKYVKCLPRIDKDGNFIRDESGKILMKYGRKYGRSYGVVVATNRDEIGWSLCQKRDYFDKEVGKEIALKRAREKSQEKVPYDIIKHVEEMRNRAERYFKWNLHSL